VPPAAFSESGKAFWQAALSRCAIVWPARGALMAETRKIAAILADDVVGFSRMASQDEDRTLARLRALRADLIDSTPFP
jgi:class 3 adenylate cyclase